MAKFGKNTRIKIVGGEILLNVPGTETADFERRLKRYGRAAKNMRPAFEEYGRYMIRTAIAKQFRAEGMPQKWTPLNPVYAERKKKQHGNKPILVVSGKLRRGFRHKATKRTLQIINRVKVGAHSLHKIHQEGTGTIPARPQVVITKQAQRKFRTIVRAHLYGRS